MSDIFISYSRKDSEQALALADRLQADGMSVWIDQRGIEAAKTWSEEIVNAIEGSKAFVLLLSSRSIESDNVVRELSLAFDSKRTLVPVLLEDVTLPAKFKYQLAGIQRVAFTQYEALSQALVNCGISVAAPKRKEERKSLLIMPFEDLSPTQDNLWFADGLADELIEKLAALRSLRIIDRKTSRDLRKANLKMIEITQALNVQYVIEGSVRKFGDQIKISALLLDVAEGEYLWQQSHRGLMEDIFDLQEKVASAVVDALRIHVTDSDLRRLQSQPTSSAEAYELVLRASEYVQTSTRHGEERCIQLCSEAVRLDPHFARAYRLLAEAYLTLYARYTLAEDDLRSAAKAIEKAEHIEPDTAGFYAIKSYYLLHLKDYEAAANAARAGIQKDKGLPINYERLAEALSAQGDLAGAIAAASEAVTLKPNSSSAHWNRVLLFYRAEDRQGLQQAAQEAIPSHVLFLKMHPEAEYQQVALASLYYFAGDSSTAIAKANEIAPHLADSGSMWNLGCLFHTAGDDHKALEQFANAIKRTPRYLSLLESDPDMETLRSLPEYAALLDSVKVLSHV